MQKTGDSASVAGQSLASRSRCLRTITFRLRDGHVDSGLPGSLCNECLGLNFSTAEGILGLSNRFLNDSYRMIATYGHSVPIGVSIRSRKFLSTNRCAKSLVVDAIAQIYSCFNIPSPEFCTRRSRFHWLQAAPAEVAFTRSGFSPLQKRSNSAFSSNEVRNLTRPTESRKLRVSCTKTSPQQTDPPTSQRLLQLPR